jgi:DNA-binding NtrC family response regulator
MPARIAVVHDEAEFTDRISAALRRAGYDVACFHEPLDALRTLERPHSADILITACVRHSRTQPHGVALALMAKVKRPDIKVVFMAHPEFVEYAGEVGTTLPIPISLASLVAAVHRLLEPIGPFAGMEASEAANRQRS